MRIAVITGEYPPMEGGVGAYTHQLALALVEAGHEVHILTTQPERADPSTDQEREACLGLTIDRVIRRWNVDGMSRARRWLRRLAPDVVNLQYEPAAYRLRAGITFAPTLLALGATFPLVVTFHDLLPPYLFPKAGPLRQWRVRQLARHATGVIATNREDLYRLTQFVGDAGPPTRLIPIGSNISASPPDGYRREVWREQHGFSPGDLVIGFFGFLNRTKGVETLLAALADLVAQGQPAHLLFIGGRTGTSDVTNAGYAEEIDTRIRELGLALRVKWTGFGQPADVSAALLSVDLCALPYREGANLRHGTLHAALAHGCAIVTTTPAMLTSELEDGRHLRLVPPNDPDALAQALATLAADPAQCQRLSVEARALAAEFTWPRIAAETISFFAALRDGDPTPSHRAVVE